jgi:ABC-type polysaccharide/polyol phosphate export permease
VEATATRQFSLAKAAKSTSTAWDLLIAVTARDLRVRYQGTFLSFVWWIARPLAMGLVLYFALGRVLRFEVPGVPYSMFLISALFPWYWFSSSMSQATGSFVGNGGLLKKVRFPKLILPLSAVFFNTVQFLLTLPVLALFAFFAGINPSVTWIVGIPLLLALQLVLLIGLGTLLASLNVFFRDLGPMLDVVLLLMFYMSAIIYPLDRVPPRFLPILRLNPVAPLIDSWRNLILRGDLPGLDIWPTLLLTGAALVLGLTAFRRLEKYFTDAL